jgi:DNA-directed RNA polymerase specialized sigma subunit
MYVKLHDCTKDINEWYIYVVMKSIFIDEIRANKNKTFIDINSIIIADDNSDSYQDSINYEILKKEFDSMKWHEKTIIKYSYEDGARECARKMGIGRGTVLNYRNKLKNKVWQKLKDPTGLEILSQSLQKQLESNHVQGVMAERLF